MAKNVILGSILDGPRNERCSNSPLSTNDREQTTPVHPDSTAAQSEGFSYEERKMIEELVIVEENQMHYFEPLEQQFLRAIKIWYQEMFPGSFRRISQKRYPAGGI